MKFDPSFFHPNFVGSGSITGGAEQLFLEIIVCMLPFACGVAMPSLMVANDDQYPHMFLILTVFQTMLIAILSGQEYLKIDTRMQLT